MEETTYTNLETDDWEVIGPKTKSLPNSHKPKPELKHIPFDELCDILRGTLSNYSKHIVAGFVYGSRARESNRPDSDADILIFWKHRMNLEDLQMIRNEVESALGIETDFVSCYLTKRPVSNSDMRDEAYFGNVMLDARRFMGTEHLADLIPHAIKLRKLTR